MVHGSRLTVKDYDYSRVLVNITISVAAGAASGYRYFKLLGKKWVENWFAKELKRYEHKLDVLKAKDEIRFNTLHEEVDRHY